MTASAHVWLAGTDEEAAMADVLTVAPSAPRLRWAPGAGSRAGVALAAGAVGLAAFVASLLLQWVRSSLEIDLEVGFGEVRDAMEPYVIRDRELNVLSSPYAVVYELGMLGLVVLLASVVLRPELAARLRLAATGLGLALGGVVLATLSSLRELPEGALSVLGSGDLNATLTSSEHSNLSGLYCAVGAVVAMVAAVWLAAVPRHDAAAAAEPSPKPSGLSRLVGTQAPAVAFFAGVAGIGGFVGSLMLDWQEIREGTLGESPLDLGGEVVGLGITSVATATAYELGVLALIVALGAIAARPALAARLRAAAVGLGLGLGGIILAGLEDQYGWLARMFGREIFFVAPDAEQVMQGLEVTILPGTWIAAATVVVLAGGIWAAGAGVTAPVPQASATWYPAAPPGYVLVPAYPAAPSGVPVPPFGVPTAVVPTAVVPTAAGPASPAPAVTGPNAPVADTSAPPAVNPYTPPQVAGPAANWSRPVGYADGLSVSTSESIDIGTQNDILRN